MILGNILEILVEGLTVAREDQEDMEDQVDQEDREDQEDTEDLTEDREDLVEDMEGTEGLVVVAEAEAVRAAGRDGRWTYGTERRGH